MTEAQHTSQDFEGGMLRSLLSLLALDDLPRTGWILRGIPSPESVAGHSLGVAWLALAVGPRETPPIDLGKALAMAVVHDSPEALSGDLPRPAAQHLPDGAKKAMEKALAAELLGPLSGPAHDAYEALASASTREARFVKHCDQLQLGVRLLGYERAGRLGLDEFWPAIERANLDEFPALDQLRRALLDARRGQERNQT